MTNLWAEASRDRQAEIDALMSAQAAVASAPYWPFLAQAGSEREFGHRLACVRDSIVADMEAAMVSPVHQEAAFERMAKDFRLMKSNDEALGQVEAAGKTASAEWTPSEWADEGVTKVVEVPGRPGYLVVDVYLDHDGTWVWKITPAYPLSEYPEVYDLGVAGTKDEAVAAAEGAIPRALNSYAAPKKTASALPSDRGVSATCPVCYRENITLRNGKLVSHKDTTREGSPQCEGVGKTASRKTAAPGDIGVGSQVIWDDMWTPDFAGDDPQLIGYPGRNGEPWTVTSIERLKDYYWTKYPTSSHWVTSDERRIAEGWIEERGAYRGISRDAEDLEVAVIERNGAVRAVPVVCLVRSSVEVGKGQGTLPGIGGL